MSNFFTKIKSSLKTNETTLKQNPVLRLLIATCVCLVFVKTGYHGLTIGAVSTIVLLLSNVIITLFNSKLPQRFSFAFNLGVITTFFGITYFIGKLVIKPFAAIAGIYLFVAIIACIALSKGDKYTDNLPVVPSVLDALITGGIFTTVLTIIGDLRELISTGKIFTLSIIPSQIPPMTVITNISGGLFIVGILLSIVDAVLSRCSKEASTARLFNYLNSVAAKDFKTALCISVSATAITTLTALITYPILKYLLVPKFVSFYMAIFALVAVGLITFVDFILNKFLNEFYSKFKVDLAWLSVICVFLGIVLINSITKLTLIRFAILSVVVSGVVFCVLAIYILLSKKLEGCNAPKFLKGIPLTLIASSIVALLVSIKNYF